MGRMYIPPLKQPTNEKHFPTTQRILRIVAGTENFVIPSRVRFFLSCTDKARFGCRQSLSCHFSAHVGREILLGIKDSQLPANWVSNPKMGASPAGAISRTLELTMWFVCLFAFAFQGHMHGIRKFPDQGVELELHLLTYTISTATPDPSHVCGLHHGSRQCRILNALMPGIEPKSSWILVGFVFSVPQWELLDGTIWSAMLSAFLTQRAKLLPYSVYFKENQRGIYFNISGMCSVTPGESLLNSKSFCLHKHTLTFAVRMPDHNSIKTFLMV